MKILIIDDEHAVRFIMSKVLIAEGHDVKTAESCEAAFALIEQEKFQLVITDLIMPDKDGIETILAIRAKYPRLRIIAMSGGAVGGTQNFLPLASRIGAEATLTKPFTENALMAAVDGTCSERQLISA